MPTVTLYPAVGAASPVDGLVQRTGVNQTFANIRSGAGNASNVTNTSDSVYLYASSTSNQFAGLNRLIFCFDTSSIPDGATITSATLSLFGASKSNTLGGSPALHIAGATPASSSTLANSDYGQCQAVSFGSISYASFTSSGYNDIALNASGIASIDKTGISKFSAQSSWDVLNSFTGSWSSGASLDFRIDLEDISVPIGNNSQSPKLTIDYTAAAPTVTTQAVSGNTSLFSATGNGNVTSDGGDAITERGVVINTTGTPTTADTKFTSAGTTGAYTASMTSLIPGQLYYVRAYAINGIGTSYGSEVSFTAVNFLNPTNAYAEDGSFTTAGGDSGVINVELSGDGGSTWSNMLSKTFNGTNGFQTFGVGSTELWGAAWTGTKVNDTNFRVRVSNGTRTGFTHIWKTFGFAPAGGVILTGIEIKIKAKWITDTTSIDVIDAKIYYGSSALPIVAGSQAYATDAATTGALEVYNGSAWKEIADTSSAQTLTTKTLTSPVINTGVSGTAILDEDNMASDSNTKLATQQSIKAYVDAAITSAKSAMLPVGSYYINETDSTNPATLLGFGTWTAVQDKFIVGHGSTYTATGGAASHSHTLSDAGQAALELGGTAIRNRRITASFTTTHQVTVATVAASSGAGGTVATALFGSTDSTTNVPPYQAAYIWKRTA